MKFFQLMCLIWTFGTVAFGQGGETYDVPCEEDVTSMSGYVGFPVLMACDDLFAYVYDAEESVNVTCSIINADTGTVEWEASQILASDYFEDDTDSSLVYSKYVESSSEPINYEIKLVNSNGVSGCRKIILRSEEFIQETCEESYKKSRRISSCYEYKQDAVLSNERPLEEALIDFKNSNVTSWWIKNCNESLKFPSHFQVTDSKQLQISPIRFQDIGRYTFAVKINKKVVYYTHVDLSVKTITSPAQILSLSCDKLTKTRVGRNAVMNCRADLGVGKDSSTFYSARIMRINADTNDTMASNHTCQVTPFQKKARSDNKDVVCEMKHIGNKPICHNVTIKVEDADPQPSYLQMKFTIKDFSTSDEGMYQVRVMRVNVDEYSVVSFEVAWSPNHWPLIITLIVIIAIILIGFLGISFYSHALWLKKRYFGPYEAVPEKYTAQLIYHWDNDEGSEDNENISTLVKKLDKFITEELHGTVYDSHREVEVGAKQDVLRENLSNCSRTIIILSDNYIKCDWNNHIVYEALKNKIESGQGVILIKTPETKVAFRSVEDAVYKTLHRAMKMCTVLEWGGKTLGRTFKVELELAMPKIQQASDEVNSSNELMEEGRSDHNSFQMNGNK